MVKMCGNIMTTRLSTKGLMEIGETCMHGPALIKYFRVPSFLSRGQFDALRLLVVQKSALLLFEYVTRDSTSKQKQEKFFTV